MSGLRNLINSVMKSELDATLTPVIKSINTMMNQNKTDGVILSVGRDNPSSTDPTKVKVAFRDGSTEDAWMSSRTVRKNDTIVKVGNRVM